jgi:predicted phage-related endonuclease
VQDRAPEADGSESAGRALRHLFAGNDTTLDLSEQVNLSDTFAQLVVLREELDEKERHAERLKQQLQQAMGDSSKAIFRTGDVSFKRSADSSCLDSKRLAAEHPDLVTSYTVKRPGTRRFRITAWADDHDRRAEC